MTALIPSLLQVELTRLQLVNDGAAVAVAAAGAAPAVGELLTATVNDPDGTTGSTFVYQWFATNVAIAGATSVTFRPTSAEFGDTISVTVSYVDDQAFAETVTFSFGAVTIRAATNTVGVVTVSGNPVSGNVLTASVVDNDDTTNSVITYQWAASGVNIAGATSRTFTLSNAQSGNTITVTADYVDDAGNTETITSEPTTAVRAVAINIPGSVAISQSSFLVGSTFTATVTDGNGTGSINYQWNAGGVDISGATSQDFVATRGSIRANFRRYSKLFR